MNVRHVFPGIYDNQKCLVDFLTPYNEQMIRYKLKMSEYRGEQAEMNIQRLNVRIDQV